MLTNEQKNLVTGYAMGLWEDERNYSPYIANATSSGEIIEYLQGFVRSDMELDEIPFAPVSVTSVEEVMDFIAEYLAPFVNSYLSTRYALN